MENKYDDYAVWSPQIMENIAKKYGEQIRQKCEKESNLDSLFKSEELLRENLKIIEDASFNANNITCYNLQKIYIKTNSVLKRLNINLLRQKSTSNDNVKNIRSLQDLKKLSIKNLCQVCKCLTDNSNVESVLDLISEIANL